MCRPQFKTLWFLATVQGEAVIFLRTPIDRGNITTRSESEEPVAIPRSRFGLIKSRLGEPCYTPSANGYLVSMPAYFGTLGSLMSLSNRTMILSVVMPSACA